MIVNNSTPRNNTKTTGETLGTKVADHVYDHRNAYLIGVGVVGGLVLARTLGWSAPPKESVVVQRWINDLAKGGVNLYGLTNAQKELWEESFNWAMKTADSLGKDITWVLGHMAQDYREFPVPLPKAGSHLIA